MNKQQIEKFIIDTLLPYKQDTSKCSYDGSACLYLTEQGNKCAVGAHMREGEWQQATPYNMVNGSAADAVFKKWGAKTVLTEEAYKFHVALKNLFGEPDDVYRVWVLMQDYHDHLASGRGRTYDSAAKSLETHLGINLTELK